MSRKKQLLGKEGEDIACHFLEQKGYQILHRNYRFSRYEVDIVAKHEGILVFVEVKLRSYATYGYPEESVSEAQVESIQTVAEAFLETYTNYQRTRFDIIAIVKTRKTPHIKHFIDAF